ncbi:MAG: carboxypeptidase regulatory-like domain-containing protein [Polaromonas sp.]
MKTSQKILCLSLVCTAVLVACGGGGDSTTATAPTAVTPVAVVPVVVATDPVTGRVTNAQTGAGLAGVTVSVGSVSATTGTDGSYSLAGLALGTPVVLAFTGTGFSAQSRSLDALTAETAAQVVNVPMLPVAFTETFDPTVARTSTVPGSTAQVQLPANALRTATGALPVGQVTARLTPLAPGANTDVMPGNYQAATATGTAPIESFGALDITYTDSTGAALNLASGQTAVLRIPLSARTTTPPATVPLFYFDTATGLWKQEQTATLMGTAPNQYYQGSVPHFSYWNADQIYNTVTITGCVQDTAGTRLSNVNIFTDGTNYTGRARATSNSTGSFTVSAKSNSTLVLGGERRGFLSNQRSITTLAANQTLTDCLVLTTPVTVPGTPTTAQSLSVRLSWGASPLDLDSHTKGPNASNEIYYASQGSLTAAPFVSLDVDDITGFGPEFTTFSKLAKNRVYSYFIHNYSGTFNPGQTGSPAQIQLTAGGVQSIFTPPAGETSSTRYWHVFNVTTDANCVATIVPVQQFLAAEPPNLNTDNNAQFCN